MIETLQEWLQQLGPWAVLMVPLLAFAESCVGIGLLISGALLVIAATAVVSNELASLELVMLLAMAGAAAGDHVGYFIGRLVGPGFHHSRLGQRYRESFVRAEAMIRRHGAMAIFIGRFIPAIRSLIPAMVGVSEFPARRYMLFDLLACGLWSLALGAIVAGLDFGFSG